MNTEIETININGYNVEIRHDDWQENPREYGYCTSTLVTAHRRYTFGEEKLTGYAGSIVADFEAHLNDEELSHKDIICLEVYLYEHGGVALSTSPFTCQWDSGQLGYIYEKRSDIRAEFGVKRISPKLEQKIFDRLDSEIETLGYWANGDVYCYSINDETCGGFYGWDHEASGLIEAATDAVDTIRQQKLRAHSDRLKQLIKCGVGLQYRPTLSLSDA